MAYLRISDDAMDHPKLQPLSHGAFRFWFCANCWCQKHLTDGLIPVPSVIHIPYFRAGYVRDLIAAGLWHQERGSYVVHDFLVHNDSREMVKERRRKKANRMASWRERRADMMHAVDAPRDAPVDRLQTPPVDAPRDGLVSSPSPHLTSPHSDPKNGSRTTRVTALDIRFNDFWLVYPKKVGKDAALRKWRQIKPDATLTTAICQAVLAQRESEQWRKDGGQFIPHPAAWLHQGRWQDEAPDIVDETELARREFLKGGPA
jgi:hypothetical protein